MLLNRGRGGAKPARQKRHREQYSYFIEHNSSQTWVRTDARQTLGQRLLLGIAAAPLLLDGLHVPASGDEKSAGTYRAKCVVCHGATGKGDSAAGKNLGVVSFSDPSVAGKSDADLRSVIEKGKNKMPAYGKSLKPEEIQGLVGYLRSLK